jgi:hypothetical protein
VLIRRLFVVAALLAVAGCALDGQDAPALSGPSELSLALNLTASPDFIETTAVSTITATARNEAGSPLPGIGLRLRVFNGGGSLSAESGVTDGNGQFSVTFFPPAGETVATIEVTPISTNAQNQVVRTVTVRVRD